MDVNKLPQNSVNQNKNFKVNRYKFKNQSGQNLLYYATCLQLNLITKMCQNAKNSKFAV